jgi:hypothetical protein
MAVRIPTPSTSDPTRRRSPAPLVIAVGVAAWLFAGSGDGRSYAAKPKLKAKPPDLKILSVDPVPLPFAPAEAPLILTIMVELPKTIPDEAVLDVTTLITSPSKLSIRLLTNRQTITRKGEANGDDDRLIEVVQTWDGTDHTKKLVADGTYDYQVQAKLMVIGKNGPLTRTTSWRKKGSFEVRAR